MLLHVSLAEADESVRKGRLKFGNFLELGNGNVELFLFVSGDSGLHVLGSFRRYRLRCKPQK